MRIVVREHFFPTVFAEESLGWFILFQAGQSNFRIRLEQLGFAMRQELCAYTALMIAIVDHEPIDYIFSTYGKPDWFSIEQLDRAIIFSQVRGYVLVDRAAFKKFDKFFDTPNTAVTRANSFLRDQRQCCPVFTRRIAEIRGLDMKSAGHIECTAKFTKT